MAADLEPGLLATARALAVDRFTAEVVTAFSAAGIEPVLLKGPTVASWLYPEGGRPYGDADLLVSPQQLIDAADALTRMGFQPVREYVSWHAHPWIRDADGAEIDLHVRLCGPTGPAQQAWDELQDWLAETELFAVRVKTLNLPGQALQVILHARQHGDHAKPREDLRRALDLTSVATWRKAERLADRLDGLRAMAAGLELEPAGQRLIERLPLVRAVRLADQANAPLAVGFARFSSAHGAREKLRVAIDAIAPSEEQVRLAPATIKPLRLAGMTLRNIVLRVGLVPKTAWALRRHQSDTSRP
jgi:Uncharacterised nucleotidyltransferase